MTTRRTPVPIRVTVSGTTYTFMAAPEIQRVQLNDSPDFVPTSGAQQAKSQRFHNVVSIKDIKSAFSHEVELRFDEHGGVIDHLFDSTLDTRWGPIYQPPAENNPAMPADAGSSWVAGGYHGSGAGTPRPAAATTPNHNPKASLFFTGSSQSGVFTWRVDDVSVNDYDLDVLRWTGTAWTEEDNHLEAETSEQTGGADMVIHKGALCFLHQEAGTLKVARSTDGSTFANMSNNVISGASPTSRLIDGGARLYCFAMDGATTGAFDVLTTDDNGGSSWDSRSASHPGQLKDVDYFYDWVTESDEIFVMTDGNLYTYDTTNFVLRHRIKLPHRGRAMLPFTLNGARALLLFMDAGRVHALMVDGTRVDISPGGSQGMPSAKDFGPSDDGQVCVTSTGQFAYILWSGLTTGGSAIAPLCLAFDGSAEIVGGRVAAAGWHYIWQKGDTSIAAAARFVAFDPVSGDLLMAVQDAVSEDTVLVQLKDIEVSPERQGTADRSLAANSFVTPRMDFGAPVPILALDAYVHSAGLGTNETFALGFRIDGSTGSYTTVATITGNNQTIDFPDNAAAAVGTSFRDIQLKGTIDTDAVTDLPKVFNVDLGFTIMWPVRDAFIMDIIVQGEPWGIEVPGAEVVWDNIATVRAALTKVTLNYSYNEGDLIVLPIPEAKLSQIIPGSEVLPAAREGTVRMVFVQPN